MSLSCPPPSCDAQGQSCDTQGRKNTQSTNACKARRKMPILICCGHTATLTKVMAQKLPRNIGDENTLPGTACPPVSVRRVMFLVSRFFLEQSFTEIVCRSVPPTARITKFVQRGIRLYNGWPPPPLRPTRWGVALALKISEWSSRACLKTPSDALLHAHSPVIAPMSPI